MKQVVNLSIKYSDVISKVKKQLSLIGKRAKSNDGSPLFSQVTLSSLEEPLLKGYTKSAMEKIMAEFREFITASFRNEKSLDFTVVNTRWRTDNLGLTESGNLDYVGIEEDGLYFVDRDMNIGTKALPEYGDFEYTETKEEGFYIIDNNGYIGFVFNKKSGTLEYAEVSQNGINFIDNLFNIGIKIRLNIPSPFVETFKESVMGFIVSYTISEILAPIFTDLSEKFTIDANAHILSISKFLYYKYQPEISLADYSSISGVVTKSKQ